MTDELFEVAFSGQIKDGADIEQVKQKVGAMFKADATKLAHLFSGKRMVIKKNIDFAVANKYQVALDKAGAICEIKSLTEADPNEQVKEIKEPVAQAREDMPSAPKTDPLGIKADDIADLSVVIAPVGSDMQDDVKQPVAPDLDISGLDMAPAGSDLGQTKKKDDPLPPSTEGIDFVD